MKHLLIILMACATTSLAISVPAGADTDTDFANELHTYGIYGQRDDNAWIGKLACQRLDRGVDTSAQDSAKFVSDQLSRRSTTGQAWQFLGGAINYYCPDQHVVLQRAAAGH